MKKQLFSLVLLSIATTSIFAQDYRDRNMGRDIREIRDIRECRVISESLRRENQSLSDRLSRCEERRGDSRRVEQLQRENDELSLRNRSLLVQVEQLKLENARLEIEAHPDRNGRFNLAESIRACGNIANSLYAQQCAQAAKVNSIQASVIEQCAKISNTYYALECVKSAGAKDVSARQVEACLKIDNSTYAAQCVQVVGEKRISSDVIRACVQSTTNTYLELECIKSM